MQQLEVMRSYVEKHLQELYFIAWLKDLNIPIGEIPEEKMIYLFVAGPHSVVK
jgi:DNA-binding transcriptional MerR regulator